MDCRVAVWLAMTILMRTEPLILSSCFALKWVANGGGRPSTQSIREDYISA